MAKETPKYIHLHRGPLDIGIRWLYNHDAIHQKEVYLCEGPPDTLTALSLGLNACGTLGRLDTVPDVNVFKQADWVYLIPDNDEAGWEGALKIGSGIYLAQSMSTCGDVKIIELPEEINDLTDWVNAGHDIEDFQKLKSRARPILEHWIERWAEQPNLTEFKLDTELNEFFYKPLLCRSTLERARYSELLSQPKGRGGLGLKKTVVDRTFRELTKTAKKEPAESPGEETIFKNRRTRSVALDVYIDEEDGKPTLLYTTWLYRRRKNDETLKYAKEVPHYLLIKPGEKPQRGLLDNLDIPGSSKEDIPYPECVNWDIEGQYSFTEFVTGAQAIKGYQLYEEIFDLLSTYLWYPDANEFTLIALYVMGTYHHPVFDVFPFLHFYGPQDVGKSTVMSMMQELCFNAFTLTSLTEAHLVRAPAANRSTIFIDEAGRFSKPKMGTPPYLQLDILRMSYKPGNAAIRFDGQSKIDRRLPEIFDPWGPKVFGSRVPLDLNLADRCLVVFGQPAPVEKLQAIKNASLKRRIWEEQARMIRGKLHTWMCQNFHHILEFWQTDLEDYLPVDLVGRTSELWAPLLCVAAFLDHEKDPDVPYMQGSIAQSMLKLQRVKTQKSRERIIGEDLDLKILEALIEVLENESPEQIEDKGYVWYSSNDLCDKIGIHLKEEYNDLNFKLSPTRLGNLLRNDLCYTESNQFRFLQSDGKKKRRTAHSINVELVKQKVAAIKKEQIDDETTQQCVEEPELVDEDKPF